MMITNDVSMLQDHEVPVKDIKILDMALDSIDDQFDGCSKNMTRQVQTHFLKKEMLDKTIGFGEAWKTSKNHSHPQGNLTRNHSIAIYVYTGSKVYDQFNTDIRNGKQAYKQKAFKWYSLYFWLTEAIQILKKTQQECKLTYRGTSVEFYKNVSNKEIRFGSFASSSLNQSLAKSKFGKLSCFKIYTCHGADVSDYSQHPKEEEVLIPPYEKFIVTNVRNDQKDNWCDTVYTLNSSGIKSNLNCALASVDPPKFHRSHSLSHHYIRGGPILSDPLKRFLVKSKHGNKQMSRLRMLRVQQRKNSKIFQVLDKIQNV